MKKQILEELTNPNYNDKKLITEFIESLDFHCAIPECENKASQKFLDSTISELDEIKKQFILTLNNI